MVDTYWEVRVTLSSYVEIIEPILADSLNSSTIQENSNTILLTAESSAGVEESIKNIVNTFSKELEEAIEVSITLTEKNQKDWVEEYKKGVNPVTSGNFFIRPEWIPENPDLINIIINPSLVFGTGDHFTTKSCIEALSEIVKKGDTVLDVGCGSGILGLVGSKAGGKVSLCDTDELAIINAKENYTLNNENYENIWVGSANNTKEVFDIVVANIATDVIIFIKKDLKGKVKRGGKLILSGILKKYEYKVLQNFLDFNLVDKKEDNEWVALVLENN